MFAGVAIGLAAVPRPFRSRVARLTGARLTGARSGGALQLSDGTSVDCFVTVGGGPVGAVSKCQAAGSVTTPVRFCFRTFERRHEVDFTESPIPVMMQTFYRATNGVTVLCPAAAVGDTGVVDGVTYTKRDRAALDALVAASPTDEAGLSTSCTTGVTDMSELFATAVTNPPPSKVSNPATFNPDLSSWDVSSVTNMYAMFAVRVPPSRVLLLLRRHVVVVRPPSPRSDITAYSTRPPVPRCAVGCRGLQPAHR